MAYYMGDYYLGDYYRGDPGLFSSVGKFLGKAAGVASFLPIPGAGIAGKALQTVTKVLGVAKRAAPGLVAGGAGLALAGRLAPGGIPLPGGRRLHPEAALPGGRPFITGPGNGRRRMNPANSKALRRAIRRTDGFIKLARRSLKGTGYTICRRGLGKGAAPRRRCK